MDARQEHPTLSDAGTAPPQAYYLSAATYVERDGKILLLKRAGGEGTGLWWIPGGAVERDERPEDAARRELLEETGLVPAGNLRVIGVFPQRVYGQDTYCVTYACACDDRVVTVSDEHTASRWIDPIDYRHRYFSDEMLASLDGRMRQLITDIRDDLDRYIEWKSLTG